MNKKTFLLVCLLLAMVLHAVLGDTALGEATRVGNATAFGVSEEFPTGLAVIGNTLYMTGSDNDVLYTVSTTTGRATRVGTATEFGEGEKSPRGLAAFGNALYMTGAWNGLLYTVDIKTGIARRVGSSTREERFPTGLATIGNTLYMVGDWYSDLYTVSTTTGEATLVNYDLRLFDAFGENDKVGETNPYGLAAIGNTLYMVGSDNAALYTVSATTGRATRVGAATEFGVGEGVPHGLAFLGGTLYMVGENAVLYAVKYQ